MLDLVGRAASMLLRLMLTLAVVVFTVSLLLAVALLVLFGLLWSLLTGRKPAPLALWQRYREAAPRPRWTRPTGTRGAAVRPARVLADVVDVQARDVTPDSR